MSYTITEAKKAVIYDLVLHNMESLPASTLAKNH